MFIGKKVSGFLWPFNAYFIVIVTNILQSNYLQLYTYLVIISMSISQMVMYLKTENTVLLLRNLMQFFFTSNKYNLLYKTGTAEHKLAMSFVFIRSKRVWCLTNENQFNGSTFNIHRKIGKILKIYLLCQNQHLLSHKKKSALRFNLIKRSYINHMLSKNIFALLILTVVHWRNSIKFQQVFCEKCDLRGLNQKHRDFDFDERYLWRLKIFTKQKYHNYHAFVEVLAFIKKIPSSTQNPFLSNANILHSNRIPTVKLHYSVRGPKGRWANIHHRNALTYFLYLIFDKFSLILKLTKKIDYFKSKTIDGDNTLGLCIKEIRSINVLQSFQE
ncbi:hypothetical protein AGLY_007619 [Aphis glycines]|uniref:Uncharacterized protein n=1 Tax=Aphis glycines TaxID=307491 RepID=A0A6G0TMQ0_APHGL|nr:hypothetical protein AGLY_007619 [Aphis glycines]